MNCYAIITTLNEESTIGPLCGYLRESGVLPVVVDDRSTDETALMATTYGAAVLVNERRMGIGPSLMRGWQWALEHGAERVVQLDAGGSHDPSQAARLLGLLDNADVVVGSRFIAGAEYDNRAGKWYRPFLSRLAARLCDLAQHGSHHSDWTSGYRAFNRKALGILAGYRYRGVMHPWQIEVLARANEAGLVVVETPIRYTAGRSSFGWKVIHETVQVWLHILNHVMWRHKSTEVQTYARLID